MYKAEKMAERKVKRGTADTALLERIGSEVDVEIAERRSEAEKDLKKTSGIFRRNLALAGKFKVEEKLLAVSQILREKFGYPVEEIAKNYEPYIYWKQSISVCNG